MISLPFDVRQKLVAARLDGLLPLIQQECDQHGYLLHPTAIKGTGGFGTVFLGEDAAGETVALKVSVPRPGMEALFVPMGEEEGRKACQLSDVPEIAAGIAWWFAAQAPVFFLVSRYVHGENLHTYRTRHPGPVAEARLCAWARQLMQGLSAMHQRGLVHRDVKPENILVERGSDQVYLTDLGIAKYSAQGTLEALRSTGTHPYAPLEQVLGSATAKSDQYALGIVLFELATGIGALPPVPAPRFGYPDARSKQLRPRQYNADLSEGFAVLIERLAALKPADRFPSMQAALERLERLELEQTRTIPLRQSPRRAADTGSAKRPASTHPSFSWRPHQHLVHLLTGRPITERGPHLGLGEIAGLMVLYYAWLVAMGLCVGFTWWAISGEQNRVTWALAGTLLLALWRIARTWNIGRLHRRGSLSSRSRAGWFLAALGMAGAAGAFLLHSVLGHPGPMLPPAWLDVIFSFFVWLYLYAGIEVWSN